MKLIIGLGNPGKKYENTRHNIGFMFLDFLAEKNDFEDFKMESKFKAEISSGTLEGEKTILIKPQTFMNLSGESVRKIVDFYKIQTEDWIVVYDDMSMDFGKIRFRDKGSAGGHNGIKSMITHLGKEFNRIKIGVGFNDNYDVSDWVLSKFNNQELDEIENNILEDSLELLKKNI